MSNKTAKTLFILSPFSSEYAGLYQELVSGIASHQQLGDRLIQLAEHAHAFRQFDKVKEIGQLLSNIPIKNYQAIGHYFLGVAANSKGNGDQDEAKRLFELVAESAPSQYKTKALLSLAAVSINAGNFDSGFYYYNETIRARGLNPTSIEAMKGMAVLKALEGYHSHAITDLENILPLIRIVQPHTYFDYLNSYAVELGEVGRMDEAENVSKLTIASPFAPYYPEWQSTFSEIRSTRKSRSTIKFSLPQEQYHELEPVEPVSKVLPFPTRQKTADLETVLAMSEIAGLALTPLQLLGVVLKIALRNRITDEEIDRICSAYYEAVNEIWSN